MITERADFLLFGYRCLSVSKEQLGEASAILLRNRISSAIDPKGIIKVRERDIAKIRKIFSGRIDFKVSEPRGVYGMWLRQKQKAAIIIGMLLSIALLILSNQVVWDIRPVGNKNIPNSEIVRRLSVCGFSRGDNFKNKSFSQIENDFLAGFDDVSWININRRGQVVYVSIIEKENENPLSDEKVLYSNIVATRDCVIEEISVKSGTPMVKPGDSVKAGDLLIMGATEGEAGGEFCRAEGYVLGRVSDKISVSADRTYRKKKVTGKRVMLIKLNIFKKSINIFKTYRNLTDECDIIEDEKEYTLPGGARLPFSLTFVYCPIYEEVFGEYTDDELIKIASDRLNLESCLFLSESDLVQISTNGEFTERGYTMTSKLVHICDVGRENSFEITD